MSKIVDDQAEGAAPVPPALRELIAKLQADADNLRAKLSEQSGNLAILKKLLGADNAGTGLDGSRTLADCATQSGESRVVHARGEAVAAEHACQWKDAIIDAAVVDWVYTAEHERNPRRAVNDLLAHQVILAPTRWKTGEQANASGC